MDKLEKAAFNPLRKMGRWAPLGTQLVVNTLLMVVLIVLLGVLLGLVRGEI